MVYDACAELREKLKKENEKRLTDRKEPIVQCPEFRCTPMRIVFLPVPPAPIDEDVD